MSKITMAAAGAIGYVLGSRAGREKYDQIAEKAESLWNNPKVQQGTRRAKQKAEEVSSNAGSDSDDFGGTSSDLGGSDDFAGTSSDLSGSDDFGGTGQGQDRDQFNV